MAPQGEQPRRLGGALEAQAQAAVCGTARVATWGRGILKQSFQYSKSDWKGGDENVSLHSALSWYKTQVVLGNELLKFIPLPLPPLPLPLRTPYQDSGNIFLFIDNAVLCNTDEIYVTTLPILK